MAPYARFLKDMYATKRATSVTKKAFLAFSGSSIISHQILDKYKDPSCPAISIVIGDQLIYRALLDLGASAILYLHWVWEAEISWAETYQDGHPISW